MRHGGVPFSFREMLGDRRGVVLCLIRLGDTAVVRDDMAAALINLGRLAWQHAPTALRLLAETLPLALETASLPQVRTIFVLCVPVLERAAERESTASLAQHVADYHALFAQLRAPDIDTTASSK